MEKSIKTKKIYKGLALCFVAVVVVTGVIIYTMSGKKSVEDTLELGNKYLSNLDYDAAIREYGNVLQIDPMNEEALTGLAMSYAGLGNIEKAEQIFENALAETESTDVWKSYAEILEESGNYRKAAQLVSLVLEKEDIEENYAWLEQILEKLFATQYVYAQSEEAVVCIEEKDVLSQGNNVLGTLGVSADMGVQRNSATLQSAAFPGTPKSVFTTGMNSYVIDDTNILWTAGSNRSTQKVKNKVEWLPSAGWIKEDRLQGVVKIAGLDATVFALTDKGELWMRGTNTGYVKGSAWKKDWTQIQGYGTILDIQSKAGNIAFLTIEGEIYVAQTENVYANQTYITQSAWTLTANQADVFSFGEYGDLVYLSDDGFISSSYSVTLPEDWAVYDEYGYWKGYEPPIHATDIAVVEETMYLLEDKGNLYRIAEGNSTQIRTDDLFDTIYASGEYCVALNKEGGYVLLDKDGITNK